MKLDRRRCFCCFFNLLFFEMYWWNPISKVWIDDRISSIYLNVRLMALFSFCNGLSFINPVSVCSHRDVNDLFKLCPIFSTNILSIRISNILMTLYYILPFFPCLTKKGNFRDTRIFPCNVTGNVAFSMRILVNCIPQHWNPTMPFCNWKCWEILV